MKKIFALVIICMFSCLVVANNQIEPFCQSYQLTSNNIPNDVNAFIVPADKVFVLLRLYVDCLDGNWQLKVDNDTWLIGSHFSGKNYIHSEREFPEGTAIVGSGKTLKLKGVEYNTVFYTIVGYFRDAVLTPSADINGDGNVNLLDLAALGSQWLIK